MSNTANAVSSAVKSLRIWLGVSGVLAIITGIVILVWPGATAQVITVVLAIYAVIGGLVYLAIGITGSMSGWGRVGHILAGLIFIVAGILAFMNPAQSAVLLATIVVTFIAIAWIFEGVAALATLGVSPSKGWTVFTAIISILAGISLLVLPLTGAVVLLWWFGIALIVIGLFQVIRAFSLGRATR